VRGASLARAFNFCPSDSRTYSRRKAANKLLDGRFDTGGLGFNFTAHTRGDPKGAPLTALEQTCSRYGSMVRV
jgi:hypothetical protein